MRGAIGYALLRPRLEHTTYYAGRPSAIAGRTLLVLDRNRHGDCLCLVSGLALADVGRRDVRLFVERAEDDPDYLAERNFMEWLQAMCPCD